MRAEDVLSFGLQRKNRKMVKDIDAVARRYDVQNSILNSRNVEGTMDMEAMLVNLRDV
jgi:hypothetical protein